MAINSKIFNGFSRYDISDGGLVFDKKLEYFIPQQTSADGYLCVTLRDDWGKRKTFKVHRLVASLFVDNPKNKKEVNHKNGFKLDNHYTNLEWATHSENIQHAWNNGLLKSTPERSLKLSIYHTGKNKGAKNHMAVKVKCLTTGEVFDCQSDAAGKYGIDPSQISNAVRKPGRSAGKDLIHGQKLKWSIVND